METPEQTKARIAQHNARKAASIEIARRLGYYVRKTDIVKHKPFQLWRNDAILPEDFPFCATEYEAWQEGVPDYFTSRDAAAELVAWIKSQPDNIQESFANSVVYAIGGCTADRYSIGRGFYEDSIIELLLVTPERVTLAACAALGIEVE